MILNEINKLKLIYTTHWIYDVMIVEIMKHLQHRHLLYMCHLSLYLYNKVHNLGSENHRCDIIFSKLRLNFLVITRSCLVITKSYRNYEIFSGNYEKFSRNSEFFFRNYEIKIREFNFKRDTNRLRNNVLNSVMIRNDIIYTINVCLKK